MLFGSWLATANASAAPEPTIGRAAASTMLRTRPVARETRVPAPTRALARPRLDIITPVGGTGIPTLAGTGGTPGAHAAHRAQDADRQHPGHGDGHHHDADALPFGAHRHGHAHF